jgi:hypothetical protein
MKVKRRGVGRGGEARRELNESEEMSKTVMVMMIMMMGVMRVIASNEKIQ